MEKERCLALLPVEELIRLIVQLSSHFPSIEVSSEANSADIGVFFKRQVQQLMNSGKLLNVRFFPSSRMHLAVMIMQCLESETCGM